MGFTPPEVPMPHVLGARGDIIAILWAPRNPLWAPPLPDRGNKILWVSRIPGRLVAPMRIFAMLTGTVRTVSLTVPDGPGPSLINMPAPGCWIMHVTWAGNTDLVRLRYAAARSKSAAQA
jgi:hypothetical protein